MRFDVGWIMMDERYDGWKKCDGWNQVLDDFLDEWTWMDECYGMNEN